MRLLTPGQSVTIKEAEPGEDSTAIRATIISATIERDLSVRYSCRWWNERAMHEVYLTRADIEPVDREHSEIEFTEK